MISRSTFRTVAATAALLPLATPGAFERNPALVWEWYNWRREKISGLKPNPAHYALRELGKRFADFTIITQNVDGLHTFAGSKDVLELHGNIWRVRCVGCAAVSENRLRPSFRRPPGLENSTNWRFPAFVALVGDEAVMTETTPSCPMLIDVASLGTVMLGDSR